MNLTDFIKYELYPALYLVIDKVFPEHKFIQFSGGWKSATTLEGSSHSRPDKTVVSKVKPGRILEQGGENLSIIDYIMKRDSSSFIDAVKSLCSITGLTLPENPNYNPEEYKQYSRQVKLLEDCNNYFIYCVDNSDNAKDIKEYLTSRGYSLEDIKAMELGYITSQDKLNNRLTSLGYTQEEINRTLNINNDSRIGSTHGLTIPYRSGGQIKGFKFRTIGEETPKYLNNKGLDKIGGFFNLSGIKGDKDLVIVEGELDSLSATVKGLDNIVATGGSSINPEQIKDSLKRGAKRFTICLDS